MDQPGDTAPQPPLPTVTVAGPDVPRQEDLGATRELVAQVLDEVAAELGEVENLDRARELFAQVALAEEFVDFLTLPAYRLVD